MCDAKKHGCRKEPKFKDDVIKLTNEYYSANVFEDITNREFPSFPQFNEDILSSLKITDFANWIRQKKIEFQTLYRDSMPSI